MTLPIPINSELSLNFSKQMFKLKQFTVLIFQFKRILGLAACLPSISPIYLRDSPPIFFPACTHIQEQQPEKFSVRACVTTDLKEFTAEHRESAYHLLSTTDHLTSSSSF